MAEQWLQSISSIYQAFRAEYASLDLKPHKRSNVQSPAYFSFFFVSHSGMLVPALGDELSGIRAGSPDTIPADPTSQKVQAAAKASARLGPDSGLWAAARPAVQYSPSAHQDG